ncbi:helix-turn-helix domain-containing protein [Leucobacter tenebrionis]|uniref:helix-turn-helix domain-containing protein n=1 Tax=Leucobacter tenebrionis TaxID=2873270 RepID=UPI001CA612AB|nr:helix-turn-helix domain-containing protein [Leucobacter tenebrionis]QZY52248.1 helix-turn-helix domain-containing protein [Leucobacter tenebrionis]
MAERNRTILVGREGGDHLDLTQAVIYTGVSRVTLMRRIADGKLPSQIVNGKHRVSTGDLDALFGPAPVLAGARTADDATLRLWAKRVAEAAPPLRPEQRDVVLSALADALVVTGGE